jgi:hypothetical protein
MLPLATGSYKYRPLKRGMSGWDVYALQTGLDTVADGAFGPKTELAVVRFQNEAKLHPDGIAGILTQRSLALAIIFPLQRSLGTPPGLARGQVESESGYQLGNHTPLYSDDTRDVGVCQIHIAPTDDKLRTAFDMEHSIHRLLGQLKQRHDKYHGMVGAKTERRAWELAAGSWNAPAWTDRLARGETLPQQHKDHIEAYIDRATIYMQIEEEGT